VQRAGALAHALCRALLRAVTQILARAAVSGAVQWNFVPTVPETSARLGPPAPFLPPAPPAHGRRRALARGELPAGEDALLSGCGGVEGGVRREDDDSCMCSHHKALVSQEALFRLPEEKSLQINARGCGRTLPVLM
jgi:hypothetical protein